MIQAQRFTPAGIEEFKRIILDHSSMKHTADIVRDGALCDPIPDIQIDPNRKFDSRFEFGQYLVTQMSGMELGYALNENNDGLWAWINALYFQQLAPRATRRAEHYICIRRGTAGSLLHRNAARTAYELFAVHGTNCKFALQQPMPTHGQLLESLSASQSIVRNKGFFAAAAKIYVDAGGKIKRGATSKPKDPKIRKPGDVSGKGSIRRLPLALRRLDLTYDVDALSPDELIARLPREYERWVSTS